MFSKHMKQKTFETYYFSIMNFNFNRVLLLDEVSPSVKANHIVAALSNVNAGLFFYTELFNKNLKNVGYRACKFSLNDKFLFTL